MAVDHQTSTHAQIFTRPKQWQVEANLAAFQKSVAHYYQMSSTSLCWRHLVNACEVNAHLIGLLAKPRRRLFLAAVAP